MYWKFGEEEKDMTAQLEDIFYLSEKEYLIIASEDDLFHSSMLGIQPTATGTGCWRGYQAFFGIIDEQLVLKTLHAFLLSFTPSLSYVVGPSINGVAPTVTDGRDNSFNNL
ncbi:MAG: hypothetical protein D3909_18840 [Candidatus Electrothrix sp. ATG1]|nr:hypothetical protein [Candidatus Electrothrix sp. ATG1]MCI5212039.1 hypothetical protein [Candidatus Electrothrix sp. ATG2]